MSLYNLHYLEFDKFWSHPFPVVNLTFVSEF